MKPKPSAPDECANCGATIPRHAKACPDCGADERTGWREQSIYDDLDLPDSAYEDEKPAAPPSRTLSWVLAAITVILVAVFVFEFVFRR